MRPDIREIKSSMLDLENNDIYQSRDRIQKPI